MKLLQACFYKSANIFKITFSENCCQTQNIDALKLQHFELRSLSKANSTKIECIIKLTRVYRLVKTGL